MSKIVINEDLTEAKLKEILISYYMNTKPKLEKLYDYYLGKQQILQKYYTDESKPCNRIVVNFCNQIVQQYLGFNIGIPVTYNAPDEILDVLKYNDVTDKDNLLLRNALIYGKSYELQYVDENGKERFDVVDSRYGIDIYSDRLSQDELKYFIRMYCVDNTRGDISSENWRIEVYDKENVYLYKCNYTFTDLTLLEARRHYYNQVPAVVFSLNEEEQSIFAQVLSLQDGYNTLISSEVDDWESFVDCYLVLKNVSATDEDIAKMKTNRVLVLDADSEAEYLIKDVNSTQIENMLDNVKDLIFKMSNAPDFSDPNFMGNSGKALQYKLTGFNNISKAIMDRMERALRKRIELIEAINTTKTGEAGNFADIEIKFTQNIPADDLEVAQVINTLRGMVSNKTLISLLPFINDANKEMKEVEKENKANAELYSFTSTNSSDEEEENV